jgi:AraC-like DNA-binding protein/mannose-6-phosphate isomerase-like protein (cupin superfamily)
MQTRTGADFDLATTSSALTTSGYVRSVNHRNPIIHARNDKNLALSDLTAIAMKDVRTYFRYLPVSPESRAWGAYVLDAGFALIPPGLPYPPCQHPADHHFTWELGRTLHSHQFLYIVRGAGEFESLRSGAREIQAGDLFIVYPEVWHRYRPNSETGWDEYWVEFDGEYVRQLMRHAAFSPEHPVLNIGIQPTLLQLFVEAVETMRRQPAEYQYLLGALAVQTIAHTLSALKQKSYEGRPVDQIIREAKQLLTRQNGHPAPLESLAAELKMSYSAFRRLFREQTGFSPRQFALEVTLRRAKDLLLHSQMPVHLIADELGFESVPYFSRFLKKKTGSSPSELRKTERSPQPARQPGASA